MAKTYPLELQQFIEHELESGKYQCEDDLLVDALKLFREMRQRQQEMRRDVRAAIGEAERGESRELDIEEVIARGTKRLADQGITD